MENIRAFAYSEEGVKSIYSLYAKEFTIDEIYCVFTGEKSVYGIIDNNIESIIDAIIEKIGENSDQITYYQNNICYSSNVEKCIKENNLKEKIITPLNEIKERVEIEFGDRSFKEDISNKIDSILKKINNIKEIQGIAQKIRLNIEGSSNNESKGHPEKFSIINKSSPRTNYEITKEENLVSKEQWELINQIINSKKG